MTATRGFTLLEILLVLVLVSVSAVAVIATFPVSVKDEAKISAQSFYQRLLLLNEEAILSGQDFGVRIDVDTRVSLFATHRRQRLAKVAKRQDDQPNHP